MAKKISLGVEGDWEKYVLRLLFHIKFRLGNFIEIILIRCHWFARPATVTGTGTANQHRGIGIIVDRK